MTTNLVHNAIVHNLPEQGTVWVTTSAHPESVVLTVENTGEKLTPGLVATLASRFAAAPNASAPTTPASASAWRSSRASPRPTTGPSPSPPATAGALRHGAAPRERDALSSASRAALVGFIGRNVSIARFAAVTSSGAPRVAMTVNSSTSPTRVWSLSETTGWVAAPVGGSPGR